MVSITDMIGALNGEGQMKWQVQIHKRTLASLSVMAILVVVIAFSPWIFQILTDTPSAAAQASVDIGVSKNAEGAAVRGQDFTYRVSYNNFGTVAAANVVLTDTLPNGLTYVS
ncbi:MAG: hypothetical protein WBW48_08835, partial [Anaerolineae bacterium]